MTAPGKLFKTTAFKLSVLYLAVFTALAAFLILYIAQNTNDLLRQEINGAIDAELKGLSEQYRLGGIRRLVDVIGNRSRRPGASLYLVTDFAGNNLTGNIAAISQQVMVVADGTAQPGPLRAFGASGGGSRDRRNGAEPGAGTGFSCCRAAFDCWSDGILAKAAIFAP